MSKLYFQEILDDISYENLPVKWQGFDLLRFSKNKTLFDFQKKALENAVKALHLYYKDKNADKESFFEHYENNGLRENFDYDLRKKQDSKTVKYLLEYEEDYPVNDNKISFAYFINRMSFWMATGSGKTLVIVKLIELLAKLIREKELPENDILFLAHRDDLLEQFRNHVEEFNSFNNSIKVNLKSLKDYENVKRDNSLPFSKNEVTVFYYRSDLISDEHKEKIVNFRNYDNRGKWYIVLDEAHKGDKEDSKRQILYSILSRNGFLFNFSATFTDRRDFVTCAFNFNLSKFVEEGYGKHIYVSSANIAAFRNQNDFSPIEKQKIVLKTLLLLTYVNKYYEEIRKVNEQFYHKPLLLTLVNSVNVEESDLELFFRELEKIANNKIRDDIFNNAKQELVNEFTSRIKFEFEELSFNLDKDLISELGYNDILQFALNAANPGNVEILKIPGNRQELIFKLKTSDRPFALIKIGDISGWLRDNLEGYEINETFENESYFKAINRDDSEINVLMGSRSFYEGWDSNRPNIILFVNIGVGKDAKKFVLQSVGRGVRIEPFKHRRKRLLNLYNSKEVSEDLFVEVKNLILPLESLFVFGTNSENLKEIIKTLREEKEEKNLGEAFIVNPEAKNHLLLIPVYKITDRVIADESIPQRYVISENDFNLVKSYYDYLGDKIALVKYDCEVNILNKAKETFNQKETYYDFSENNSLSEPELILERIFDYLGVKTRELDSFKEIENEIVHFRHIKFRDNGKYNEIIRKIDMIKNKPESDRKLDELFKQQNRSEYDKQLRLFEEAGKYEVSGKRIRIKYLANHYYLPVIISESEKIDYINHIIKIPGEVRFIEELESYLEQDENVFKQFDWWMFSKLDETLDEVTIPYYNPNENRLANFKPDFIFWLQKGNKYIILFVDPKGTEHSSAYRKIDGYSRMFEEVRSEVKICRDFSYGKLTINVKLMLKAKRGIASVPDEYKRYWFDSLKDFEYKL